MTLEELKERIEWCYDEVSILELLNITSKQILDRFSDLIEKDFDKLSQQFGDEEVEGDIIDS